MSQDREERFRGLGALQGLGMIVFGAILVIAAAVADYRLVERVRADTWRTGSDPLGVDDACA
jgi:hypothetical protein